MSKFELYLEACANHCKTCNCDVEEDDSKKRFTRLELAQHLSNKLGHPVAEKDIKTNTVKGHMDLWVYKGQTYKKA